MEAREHGPLYDRIIRGYLELVILLNVSNGPKCGYELIKHCTEKFGFRFGSSTIYPTLEKMEKSNLLSCSIDESHPKVKKIYSITENGNKAMNMSLSDLDWISKYIKDLFDRNRHN